MKSSLSRENRCIAVLVFLLGTVGCQSECPPQERILPCKCLLRGEELQVWCTHSEYQRISNGLKSLAQYVKYPIDELILEDNDVPSLPGRAFAPLQIMRLMLRNNGLERISSDWLAGSETSLLELYIVEPVLRSFPEDSLRHVIALEAVTIQAELMKRVPEFSGLSRLRHLHVESTSLTELSPRSFKSLPLLEKFHVGGSPRLGRLESGLLQDLPRLNVVNISRCAIAHLHPRTFARLPALNELILSANKIADAGVVGRAVANLPSLTVLRLDNNDVDKLESAAFVDLPSLKHLSLDRNRIAEIHRGAFHRLPNLKTLDLSGNSIRRIHPESFLRYSAGGALEELRIDDNEIGNAFELNSLLAALPRLLYLDASRNRIREIPYGAIRGHPTLEQLHLNYNQIRSIEREAFAEMPALRELRLKNNSLADSRGAPFWNLPALKGLDLSQNYYGRVEPRLLANVPSLRRVDFSGNSISAVDPTSFLDTPALEHVNLSGNALTLLHPATFRHLANLYELDVSANALAHFVPGLPRGIENLFLQRNKIANLPAVPSPDMDLPSLRFLDVSSNGLQRIAAAGLSSLPRLRKLRLHDNGLKSLERGSLDGLTRLKSLDLGRNRLMVMHESSLKDLTELQELSLRSNLLELIRPELFLNAKRLKKLDVSRNHLSELALGTLDSTRELQVVDASFNNLADFPYSLRGLKHLKTLDLTHNRIGNVRPDVLGTLTSLEELRMSQNQVRELRKGFFSNLPDLSAVHVDGNEIESMDPYAFNGLPNLAAIRMGANRLRQIPDFAFSELPSLEVTELQENRLTSIATDAFHRVPKLSFLNLSSNELTGLEEAGLRNLKSLQLLDVSRNRLTGVATSELEKMEWLVELKMNDNEICSIRGASFDQLPRLRVLNLRNNKIATVPESAVNKMKYSIAVLDVDGNPLRCSCGVWWLRTWLQQTGSLGPRCSDGTLLREMRLSRQECTAERNAPEPPTPGCESEYLTSLPYGGTSQVLSHWMDVREQTTTTQPATSAPSPEESDYFYEEYVDYPYNESNSIDRNRTSSDTDHGTKTSGGSLTNQKSSHFISGDTPTLYAAPNTNQQKQQDVLKGTTSPSPSSSGFTFFGVPLPSLNLNKLWPGSKKGVERKTDIIYDRNGSGRGNLFPPTDPDVQTGGFVPILPGSGGFKPMLNPPNEMIPTASTTNADARPVTEVGTPSTSERSISNGAASSNPVAVYDPSGDAAKNIAEKYVRNVSSDLEGIAVTPADASEDGVATKSEFETFESGSSGNPVPVREVDENIHVVRLTTILPEEERATDANIEIYKEPTATSTRKNVDHDQDNANDGSIGEKDSLTPLSVLLVPGGQLPPYRPSGKSTITKVPSPHSISTSPLLQPVDNATERLPPTTKKRKIFSNVDDVGTSPLPSQDRSTSWYFINYNKTNLQPYVDPALNAHTQNNHDRICVSALTVVFVSCFVYFV